MNRIGILATWHPRCGPWHYAEELRLMGHEVVKIGPYDAGVPFGTRGREPDVLLPQAYPPHYRPGPLLGDFDQFWIIEGGEDIRVLDLPDKMPLVHVSTEGTHLEWTKGRTPHRYAEIMCNVTDPEGVTWLPKCFSEWEYSTGAYPRTSTEREYDLVQLASARAARVHVWNEVKRIAPDLNCVFGDQWGPLYYATYENALATFVCHTHDFVTTRVFEAMAAGCVVFSDPTPSMLKLFEPGKHFVPFEAVWHAESGEGYPDPEWLAAEVREMRKNRNHEMIAGAASRLVWGRDSMKHRVETVLTRLDGWKRFHSCERTYPEDRA